MQSGIAGLYYSRKACFCLTIFATASAALFLGKLEGLHYAAIVSVISSIWLGTHTAQQVYGDRGGPGNKIP
jgi:hypothetical protein